MNSRKRMIRSIEFIGPDRLPRIHSVWPKARRKLGAAIDALLDQYPDDVAGYFNRTVWNEDNPFYEPGEFIDAWGCKWMNDDSGHQGVCVEHPLEDWSKWSSFQLPALNGAQRARAVEDEIATFGHEHYVLAGTSVPIFQKMINLRGWETVMIDLATGATETMILRDAMLEWVLACLAPVLKTDCDGVGLSDDWGTQTALMADPELWRRVFRPMYASIVESIRAAGKHAHFHSDGYTLAVIPDLIDIGLNVLNVEHPLIGEEAVGAVSRGKVCFRTYIDGQHVLPYGTPDDVRVHVRQVVKYLSTPEGGIIAYGEVAPDVPLENARAMYETFAECWPEFAGTDS